MLGGVVPVGSVVAWSRLPTILAAALLEMGMLLLAEGMDEP